ncbi:unnamed protein product [Leptidea sinapis]|uniref:Uncharacterized protein n=1 Tax=Leptidea sinapis TaxID=189913 RepID=A0A5E4Q6Q2_9NEOP|nr:unnamed protein product [Leptidea sinapis]
MLITILGLPLSTKYHEIKVLITQKCGIPDFILDNLLTDTDGTKKVRVGLADDAEGAHVIKCLNGYKLSGNVLRVVPFGKSGIARQNNSAPNHRSTFETQGYQNDFNQMGRSQVDPWGSHSQWTPQQQTGHIQNQNNLSYQQVQQGGGYVSVNRQGVLRTVEIVETPPQNLPGRHQPNYDLQRDRNGHEQKMDSYEKSDYGKYMPQDKRILKEQLAMKYKELDKPQYDPHEKKMLKEQLAMKYKHLEKSQYSPQNMHARGLQPRQVSPSPRHSPGRKMTGRMRSPPRRSVSPHGRRLSPPGRRLSPSGRRPSPSAGRTSPMGRSRRMSPGRRVSPAGRNPMEPPVDRRMPSKCVPPPPKTPKMATDVAVRKPQHVIAKKPRLVAAKPSEPPKKYTPVEKDEGSAHVTVTPCYRFMKCPEGLKTKFVDESDAEKDTSLVSENAEKKSEDTTEIIKSADESQKINDGNKKEDELKVAKTIKIEEADNTNKVETAREIAIEANTNISEKMKTEEPSMPQKITSKIIPDVKKEVSKAEEGKKMEVNKNKLTKVNETTIEKSSPQVESVEKTLKDTNAKIVENKPTVKQEFVKNVAKIQTQGKTITKPVNSLQAQTKRVEVKKNLKNVSKADDFEEMADDEILALLSSGVVLDECGSDEE